MFQANTNSYTAETRVKTVKRKTILLTSWMKTSEVLNSNKKVSSHLCFFLRNCQVTVFSISKLLNSFIQSVLQLFCTVLNECLNLNGSVSFCLVDFNTQPGYLVVEYIQLG